MKSSNLIIKIAVAVAGIAAVFSLVTLIRAIYLHLNIVFSIVQVVVSLAIFAVCLLMLRLLKASKAEEEDEESDETDEKDVKKDDEEPDDKEDGEADDDGVKALKEKYHLTDVEDDKDEDKE